MYLNVYKSKSLPVPGKALLSWNTKQSGTFPSPGHLYAVFCIGINHVHFHRKNNLQLAGRQIIFTKCFTCHISGALFCLSADLSLSSLQGHSRVRSVMMW
jgi:hypothetical protein